MTAVDHAELKREEGEGRSPVYAAAYDTIRKGAPGLSDATCAVLAASINMKVSLTVTAPLLSEIEGLKAERAEAKPWQDREDEWSEAISAAHPVNSSHPWKHKCFETAMEMVGNRRGKYELVALVSWLLSDLQSLRTQAPDSWRLIETAPKDGETVLIFTPRTCPHVTAASYRSDCVAEHWASVEHRWHFPGDVTHWMPLPAAPALRPQTAESAS